MKMMNTNIVGTTFEKIANTVTPTMGAKGLLAVIADEFSRPYLTDDGVTVARECMHLDDPFEKMIATSMIEAASNTEKTAFDGTTLTILLTHQFYKAGKALIDNGMHPQTAAATVEAEVAKALAALNEQALPIREGEQDAHLIKSVANITTKIPAIGELVYEAYRHAGKEMNIIIEHDRKNLASSVEHVDGMIINSGYFSETFKKICNDEDKFVANNAKIIMLAEGIITPVGLNKLLGSIVDTTQPLVFVVHQNFNPESLATLIDALVNNKLVFMFVFLNESNPEPLFLDIAAKTNGLIQSGPLGTVDYIIDYAGTAEKIIIEQDKTTIIASGNEEEIQKRIFSYRKELEDNKFAMSITKMDQVNRRISNLDRGVTKIRLACATITEFRTIRMKLDDAIGAVRCACRDGIIVGGGKTLYAIGEQLEVLKHAFKAPFKTIIGNAGLEEPDEEYLKSTLAGLDVNTGKKVNLYEKGIIDSKTSAEQAIKNASSIATSYLKAYTLINSSVSDKD